MKHDVHLFSLDDHLEAGVVGPHEHLRVDALRSCDQRTGHAGRDGERVKESRSFWESGHIIHQIP
jgi:hypothetical protein